ncbi:mechanosensitive ion channel family protein [Pontibacter cellulosilyticus]|uniref:Mechanosensitive ion channel n=1 Tax=Pontibacter cellulosilyticus TaxID=1720253 RepID=A0A923N500_9BACT|nr:mechanosensitive ion channel family protein [Pontibacter cellulosilyticus]MBC5992269.1 mechanosensitive ion channel [Pontibacter cellulosilyticus]
MQESKQFEFSNATSDLVRVVNEYWEKFIFLLPNILIALLIFFVFLWLASKVRAIMQSRLNSKSKDQITADYLALISKWIVLIVGILLVLQTLGLSAVAGGILAGAGVSALVIGFAFKDIAENFLAGLILAFNRPFELGDSIEVTEIVGKVKALNLRTTHIRTFDSRDVFIPNGTILTSNVVNLTANGLIRSDFVVGIDYNDNIQDAIDLIERIAKSVEGVLQKDPPYATVDELGVSTVNIKVFFWAETDDYKKGLVLLKGRVMQEVTKALLGNGFGLPADIQELKLYDYQKTLPVELVNGPKEQHPAQDA